MKTYITAAFTYSRTKLKNSFAKVKNKKLPENYHPHTYNIYISHVQCVKCSKVDIMKATLER